MGLKKGLRIRMNILFIDHECHKKTRSADFFVELLQKKNDVRMVYYKKAYGCQMSLDDKNWADVIVIWEFLLSRYALCCIDKPCIFVPMYDNEWGSFWQWKRIAWSGIGILSFCGKVSAHARSCGVDNILDVRYFPNPSDFPQMEGDPKRVFLWERDNLDRTVAERLFPSSDGYVFDIKRKDEFVGKSEFLERISKCGVVIAPRRKEGIGMAFLEAMAMGKCVVANDDATMNEYIRNGENGILFSLNAPRPVLIGDVERVIRNVQDSAVRLHDAWLADRSKIESFISHQSIASPPSWEKRQKIAWTYPLFVAEWVSFMLRKGLSNKWKKD